MKKFFILTVLLLLSVVDTHATSAYEVPTSKEAVDFVKDLINQGITVANKPGDHQAEFGQLLESNFITAEIANFVLGSKKRSMSPDQQARFRTIYQRRLVQIYSAPEKVSTFKNTTPIVLDAAVINDDKSILVKSTFANKDGTGAPAKVDWKVVKKNGKTYIFDVLFEGISKLTTERNDYGAIYTNQGKNNPETFLTYLKSTLKA